MDPLAVHWWEQDVGVAAALVGLSNVEERQSV